MSALAGDVGEVVRGRNGRLFLGRQDGFDLGRFTDGTALPPSLLTQWRATLARRGRELSARGIPYIVLLAPDAPTIHPEDLPPDYPPPHRMAGDVFVAAMGDIPGVSLVHPVAALRGARGGLDVYQRTDSHWTGFGAGIACRELMSVVSGLVPCRTVPPSAVAYYHRSSFGDLGSRMDPEERADIPVAVFDGPEPVRAADHRGAQRQTAIHTRMPSAPPCRVLAFRDSFMTDLSPHLARSFGDLLTVGTTTRVMLDAVDSWLPDLVISEVAERRLCAFQTDHQPHGFSWMYLTDHSSDIGRVMLTALNLMPQDPVAAAAAVRTLGSSLADDPSHAYSAAHILETAGEFEAALGFVRSILGAIPDDPPALSMAARLVLGAGRASEAVGYLERAAAAAPWNGAHAESLAYSLIQDARPVEAAAVLERAVALIDDHANLWYWTGVMRAASGSPEGALEAVDRALAFDPRNAAYLELAARSGARPVSTLA